jgi:putative membrane protein
MPPPATDLLSPPALGCGVAAVIYWRGTRPPVRVDGARSHLLQRRRWRALAFYAGLVTIVVALVGPMDGWSDHWFWVHMSQHLLLMMVAAPLVIAGAPWEAPWRLIGHGLRMTLIRSVGRSPRWALVRAAGRALARPPVAWLVFNVTLLAWHLPALYDLAVRNQAVHDLEHALMFGTGLLFWSQVIDSPPLPARLDQIHRVGYIVSAALVGWVLALGLALPGRSLYPAYAVLHHGSAGLSAVGDQQLAAGMMWVPGSVPYSIAVTCALYRWLDERQHTTRRRRPKRVFVAQEPTA